MGLWWTMNIFDLIELLDKDNALESLGFDYDIIDLETRPTLRIWGHREGQPTRMGLDPKELEEVMRTWVKKGAFIKLPILDPKPWLELYRALKKIFGEGYEG